MEDLVNQAERLTADIAATSPFPRVERNLKQLAQSGKELWSRTAQSGQNKHAAQVSASILLAPCGFDLAKATQQLDSLTSKKQVIPVQLDTQQVATQDTVVQSFLKSERENAVLSAVEQIKKKTLKDIDKFYWESLQQEWEEEKLKILKTQFQTDQSITGDVTMKSNQSFLPTSGLDQTETVPEPRRIIDTVIDLIKEGKPYEPIVGAIQSDGCRIPGSLDKLRQNVNVEQLIEEIAYEAEKEAFLEDAVKLYDIAGVHTKALEILNKLLAGVISCEPGKNPLREKVEQVALIIAERYSIHGHNADKKVASTFFLLLDLMTFFTYYHRQSFHDALDTITKLSVVPMNQSQLDGKVEEFKKLSIQIQRNIPEILVACMNILYAQYRETKLTAMPSVTKFGMAGHGIMGTDLMNREQRMTELREKARTLITFAGMIPYRMSGEVNAKLVQLEVLMN